MSRLFRSLAIAALALVPGFAQAESVSPPDHVAVAPDLAVAPNGDVALLWVDRSPELSGENPNRDRHLSYTDLYIAVSRDGGETFGPPAKVNHDEGVVWGQSVSRPRIVGSPTGTWHVSYAANEIHSTLGKTALTIHYTRSTDGAATFAPPNRLSTLTDADMSHVIHGGFMSAAAFGTLTTAQDGRVYVAWVDTRWMSDEVDTGALYTAVSDDDGETFNAEKELLKLGVCPCCQMMAATDADSNIYIGLRQVMDDGTRQSTVARLDAGETKIASMGDTGTAPWKIEGCPLKPTVVATHGDSVFTAVYSGGEEEPGVFVSHSTDNGRSFARATPAHPEALVSDAPSIAANDESVMVAWHAKTDGPRSVFYRRYDLAGAPVGGIMELDTGDAIAEDPVLAVRPDGKFLLAWLQEDGIHTTVLPDGTSETDVGMR